MTVGWCARPVVNDADMRPRWKKWLRLAIISLSGVALTFGSLAGWQWSGSHSYEFESQALGEVRSYRVFNESSEGVIVLALDGQSMRHSLAPAVIFSVAEWVRKKPLPKIVAVDSNASRDRDFRPNSVTPTNWRPDISGRSPRFDRFVLDELGPQIEGWEARGRRRYLIGHSLAGLYVLDLASRYPSKFDGFAAFAPTLSHDVSIAKRLPGACSAKFVYANWGLESARDTKVFSGNAKRWRDDPRCQSNPPQIVRHYGSLHQTIMLTGQLHLAVRGFE